MTKYLLLLLLPFTLYASKILSYNIYDRSDRVDVMITFDTPYKGTIRQSRTKKKIIIKLEDATIEAPKIKKVSSKFLQTLTITPLKSETQIIAVIPSSVKLIASKTADAYGLRLRFTTKKTLQKSTASTQTSNNSLSALPTKKESDMRESYYIVIAILLIGIITLFYIKKKIPVPNRQATKEKNSWLFKSNEDITPDNIESKTSSEVTIRFQKAIDSNNSVVMLDFGQQSYLVLMGNNNILLDKFRDNIPTSQQEFETILQERHEELEDFLQGKATSSHRETTLKKETKEPLQAYKERAASLLYSEED